MIGQIGCPETSVINYQCSRSNPEESSSQNKWSWDGLTRTANIMRGKAEGMVEMKGQQGEQESQSAEDADKPASWN